MSGHSKWSTIKRQKGAADAKRGQQFSKLAKAITIAARQSGPNPEGNFKLRLVIDQARNINMPKDNIERAMAKATGRDGAAGSLEEVVYEGYGPGGVAVMIEAVTDNKQRTGQEIRTVLDRSGGSLAGPGAVSWMFKRFGLITMEIPTGKSVDEATLEIIDLEVEDVEEADNQMTVYTTVENLEKVKKKIESGGYQILSSEITMKPTNISPIADKNLAGKVLALMGKLEDMDDVQKVHANFAILKDVLEEVL